MKSILFWLFKYVYLVALCKSKYSFAVRLNNEELRGEIGFEVGYWRGYGMGESVHVYRERG